MISVFRVLDDLSTFLMAQGQLSKKLLTFEQSKHL